MSRGLKAVCALVLMALSYCLSPLGWAMQGSSPLADVQKAVPGNLKLMQDALQKRQAAQLPPGPLNDSNAAVVQTLRELVQRTTALQSLLAAGPTSNEVSLIVDEWGKIKARMPDVGLTPREQAGMAAANNSGKPSPPGKSGTNGSSVSPAGTTTARNGAVAATQSSSAAPAAQPAATDTPVDLTKLTFSYVLGVSPKFQPNGQGFQGGCTIGSNGITSDAAVWDVVITLVASQMQGLRNMEDLALTDEKTLIVPLITMDPNAELLVRGRRAYIGRSEQNIINPKFHFRQLSLNEVTDLLQSLKANDAKIQAGFGAAMPTMSVYQITVPDGEDPDSLLFSLEGKLLNTTGISHENLVNQLKANEGKDLDLGTAANPSIIHIPAALTIPFSPPQLSGDTADELGQFAARLANIGAKANIDLTKAKGKRITHQDAQGKEAAGADSTGKPLIIENECFQLSFVPGIQNGGISPAANFRGRISYLPEHLPLTLKLSAEGEAASDTTKPRRVSGSGDVTYLSAPFFGGWYATFGASGDASYAQMAGIGVTEWRGGGKFELQTPTQRFFPVRGGNDQKPTFTIEAGGVGGSTPNTNTNFIVRGDFVYTLQPSAKIFLDFRAAAAHSEDRRFAGRNDFSFGGFTGRYTIYNDWDFIAKYECGRKDPLYVKSCGWQTGFGLKTK